MREPSSVSQGCRTGTLSKAWICGVVGAAVVVVALAAGFFVLARLQQKAIDSTRESLVITDARNRVVSVNPALFTITGYTAAQAIGRDPRFLDSGRHDAAFFAEMWGVLGRSGHWQGEIWNRRRNGELFPADGTDADTLMRTAGVAMYRAKRRGRRSHAFGGACSGGRRRHSAGSDTAQLS